MPFVPENTQSLLRCISLEFVWIHSCANLWGKIELIGRTSNGLVEEESCFTMPIQFMTMSGLKLLKTFSTEIKLSASTSDVILSCSDFENL